MAYTDTHDLTVSAGLADLAWAVAEDRQPFLSADYCLHLLDVSLRLSQAPESRNRSPCPPRRMKS